MARLQTPPPRERSSIRDLHTTKAAERPFVVYADCRLTRRKRHHIITDGRDSVVFRSRWWSDILEWLADENETSYIVITDRDRYATTSERQPNPESE